MTATTTDRSRDQRRSRGFEIVAVLLLGVATLGSAWCGYQASRWNGQESRLTSEASNEQVEGARLFGLATPDRELRQHRRGAVRGSRRPPATRACRTSTARRSSGPTSCPRSSTGRRRSRPGGNPGNLLEDEEYRNEQLADYEASQARAEALSAESREAGNTADDFILLTVLFASALFFAGVTTSFRLRSAQALLLLAAGLIIAYAAARLADLPVA